MEQQLFTLTSQNKNVTVILEFPKCPDKKAEQEFINRIKVIYLEKLKLGVMQKNISKDKEGVSHE